MKQFIMLLLSLFVLSNGYSQKETPPVASGKVTAQKKAQPVELSVKTIASFINWASGSTRKERDLVRAAIAKANPKVEISSALFKVYDKAQYTDFSKAMVILSIIGELRVPEAANRLYDIAMMLVPERSAEAHNQLEETDKVEMLATKAIEGLAYLKSQNSDEMLFKIISTHPSRSVRATAINAYLFNNKDSKEAKKLLAQYVQKEDAARLDVVRFTQTSKPEAFNTAAKMFYDKYPKENPELPEIKKENQTQDAVKSQALPPFKLKN